MNIFKKGYYLAGAMLGFISEEDLLYLCHRYGDLFSPSAKKILKVYFKHNKISEAMLNDMDIYGDRLWRLYFRTVLPGTLPADVRKHIINDITLNQFSTLRSPLDGDTEIELFRSDKFDKMIWYVRCFKPTEGAQEYLYDIIDVADPSSAAQYERVIMEMLNS